MGGGKELSPRAGVELGGGPVCSGGPGLEVAVKEGGVAGRVRLRQGWGQGLKVC